MAESKKIADPSDNWTIENRSWDAMEMSGQLGPREFEFGVTGSGKPAWHGETEVHEGELYVEDVLQKYGFDDPVEKVPMYIPGQGFPIEWDDGKSTHRYHRYNAENLQQVPRKYATRRTSDGKILGTVGEVYRVVQTVEAFAFINALLEAQRVVVESCVSLRGGAVIALSVRKPENILIAGEDVMQYINCLNGFDGKTPVVVLASPVRFVCMNTVRLGLQLAENKYVIKHTREALNKLQKAREGLEMSFKPSELDTELASELRKHAEKTLDVTDAYAEQLQKIGNDLATFKMTNKDFERFIKKLVPITDEMGNKGINSREEKRAEIRALWMSEPNLENIRNTAWGVLNAVIQYSDHVKKYDNQETKAMSILQGNNDNQRAFELLKN